MFEVSHTTVNQLFLSFFFFQSGCAYGILLLCVCAQSCLTLWNPMDRSPSDSSVHGILQARILE